MVTRTAVVGGNRVVVVVPAAAAGIEAGAVADVRGAVAGRVVVPERVVLVVAEWRVVTVVPDVTLGAVVTLGRVVASEEEVVVRPTRFPGDVVELSEGGGVTVNAGRVVETLGLLRRADVGALPTECAVTGGFPNVVVENDEEPRRDVLVRLAGLGS